MRINRSLRLALLFFAVNTMAALTASTRVWAQNSSAAQYHLIKKIVLGGDGGWDYFTVDPETHHIFIVSDKQRFGEKGASFGIPKGKANDEFKAWIATIDRRPEANK